MAESPALSHPGVNSGAVQLRPGEKQRPRPHPPRLQHSPSMPNIWFPPHSGPLPPRLIESGNGVLKRPSTPPSPVDSNVVKVIARVDSVTLSHDAQTQLCDVETVAEREQLQSLAASTKTNRRRRMNYDQSNVLLTPPLTPSSSIRTAGSIDSTVSYNTGADSTLGTVQLVTGEEDVGFIDPDTISTRFLLIRNVSRKVTSDVLQFAILRALAGAKLMVPHPAAGGVPPGPPRKSAGSASATSNPHSPVIDTIKGVLLRYHESHGIAILAFYDIRQAKSAQTLLSTPTTGTLADCVGEECKAAGQRGWLDCGFVTAGDLAEMVGKSPFLMETHGSFLFAVEVNADPSDTPGSDNPKREIKISTLLSVLKAYGDLRSFGLAQGNQQTSSRKIFRVEYYDVRDANAAYSALDGQVMFGMQLSRLERDSQYLESPTNSKTADSESHIPFPGSNSETPSSLPPLQFGQAGQDSQIRQRFLFIDTSGKVRPRSVSAGHESLEGSLNSSLPLSSSDSPPYFYTSPPTSPCGGIPPSSRTPDSHSRRASNHLFFDAVGRPCNPVCDQPHHTPKRPRSVSFDSIAGAGREHEREDDSAIDPPSGHNNDAIPPVEYFYQPLDRLPPSPFPQPYYNVPTPPLPAGFSYSYPPHHAQLMSPGMGYPGCPSPLGYAYEYDPHANAVMNMNMAFEQAMMVPTTPVGLYAASPYTPPNASAGIEYWQGTQSPVPPHTAYFHCPPHSPDSPRLSKLQPPAHPPFSHSIHLPSPPSPVAAVPRAIVPPAASPNSANAAERNQLNLARIEDGQDTRTTVMIKNIPNKMSDKDLMAYIGGVCARKIDFLYLRMDFQNGCNVGYAFVNFINVQDLLRFAKAKLGEKWNMFSSEKVLQMSYANYQGKEALVEKFKNSCIMDERESWQPKIFYSDPGPEQGLPEPFPAPTHLRRKERSSYNRGPLYVPGMMGGLHSPLNRRHQGTDEHRDRLASSRHNERPRRFRDADEQNGYSLADGMAAASLGVKKPSKK
ncbi:hypothetical protein B0H17DRAFT_1127438 [Mycena rosella]|uniref:RRM domain-containing protein n=1 Tax=Mycena rosella TaxID=1033263 RepID=A0AAD7GR32_MYCRO|nr:hypothetical protein B0H17DRAFT_1127438 [Mycena rosella]